MVAEVSVSAGVRAEVIHFEGKTDGAIGKYGSLLLRFIRTNLLAHAIEEISVSESSPALALFSGKRQRFKSSYIFSISNISG